MENNYRVSHTAFPDGNIVTYEDGMCRPTITSMDKVMKDSLFKAIVKQGRKKSAKIIRMEPSATGPMYAVK